MEYKYVCEQGGGGVRKVWNTSMYVNKTGVRRGCNASMFVNKSRGTEKGVECQYECKQEGGRGV